ncbi:sulfate ABC transporter substrate-binding protein [Crenobacter caeni]|uniref:Sulfate ABC transporter substrate-binding protein n=1 Tax=Crenobacter caeni TaxID=2705474 RepID=A0A6B2KM30_9NEIS|nr:sulfate ABC transporter substrate-binding protein [Crenobacter caeni]NDV11202.1 sulfate ABC transporter substrate-binding protein [Crenobacter caeni]
MKKLAVRTLAAVLLSVPALPALADVTLLNVSYDVMRDFYKDYNPAFQKHWKGKTGEAVTIQQSHGGSSKQAMSVVGGLQGDVITMNQAPDINILAERGALVPKDWSKRLANDSVPFTSSTVFLVRKGNPKGIRDWKDLAKPGVQVIVPNPKTSGNGRYSYLAAYGWALKQPGGNDASARAFVGKLFGNAPVLDTGGRAATTTFMQRQIGDVLITFENEAEMVAREFGRGTFEVVYPSLTVSAENPVAVVDKVVDKKGTRKQAEAYLAYLWSPEGQTIAAQNYLRPQDKQVAAKFSAQFPPIKAFRVVDVFGSWDKVMKTHFADGGVFDQIYLKK